MDKIDVREVVGRESCITATLWLDNHEMVKLPFKLSYPEINANYEITFVIVLSWNALEITEIISQKISK